MMSCLYQLSLLLIWPQVCCGAKDATVSEAEHAVNETVKYSFTVWTLVSSFIVSPFVIK